MAGGVYTPDELVACFERMGRKTHDLTVVNKRSAVIVRDVQRGLAKGSLKADIQAYARPTWSVVRGGQNLRYFLINELGGRARWHRDPAYSGFKRIPIGGGFRMRKVEHILVKPRQPEGYFFFPGYEASKGAAAEQYALWLDQVLLTP